jgi:hypothetical protein
MTSRHAGQPGRGAGRPGRRPGVVPGEAAHLHRRVQLKVIGKYDAATRPRTPVTMTREHSVRYRVASLVAGVEPGRRWRRLRSIAPDLPGLPQQTGPPRPRLRCLQEALASLRSVLPPAAWGRAGATPATGRDLRQRHLAARRPPRLPRREWHGAYGLASPRRPASDWSPDPRHLASIGADHARQRALGPGHRRPPRFLPFPVTGRLPRIHRLNRAASPEQRPRRSGTSPDRRVAAAVLAEVPDEKPQ